MPLFLLNLPAPITNLELAESFAREHRATSIPLICPWSSESGISDTIRPERPKLPSSFRAFGSLIGRDKAIARSMRQ